MIRPFEPDPVPPACEPTVERLQAVLDGELSADALETDPHPADCPVCRDRIRAARLLLTVLAEPAEPCCVPAGLTGTILAGVRADRRRVARQRVAFAVGGLAVAAAVVVAVWWFGGPRPVDQTGQSDFVREQPQAPTHEPAPVPRPIRINDEIAKAGGALRESSRTITEPATSGPRVFASFTNALTRLPVNPVVTDLEPARRSLAEIPVAAQAGLEPVTESAQKALNRLLKDVGSVSPPKPKS
jgi:hypothetical protein